MISGRALFVLLAACGGRDALPPIDDAGSAAIDSGSRDAGAIEAGALPDAGADPGGSPITAEAQYLVTVVTGGWDDSSGTLRRYRRDGTSFVDDGAPIAIMLGRSGLGWGRGLHGDGAVDGVAGPEKREGDGRSPAGVFLLDHALGYAPSAPSGTRIRYQAMTPTLQCIEDVESSYYNRIVDRALVTPDWDSTDRLMRSDGLYEFLVYVAQNTEPAPVPGRGSCILLHVWSSPTTPTAGCTSMERDRLEEVVQSLAPDTNLLVQLPAEAYDALAAEWGLPLR
jgi:L,D-peptidoglycan transpeptidase YkuD (ErfK/YbiS/YcfS/YnhG family)